MTLNRKRERFDDLPPLFDNQSFSMSNDTGNHILPLKFPSDEIRGPIDLNFTMSINLSVKGNFSLCNRKMKMTRRVNVCVKGKSFWAVSEISPVLISEYTRESCAVLFLSKGPVGFLIMVIPRESFTGSSKGNKGRTSMSSKHPLLPEFIKTFNRGISSWFSLRDKYQIDSQKQMKTDDLREAKGIASSTCSSHLIVHLRYAGNSHKSPCFNKMFAQRDALFIRELACESCVTCNIHRMKGIESGNTLWPSEISWANKVCLVEISHLLSLNIRIRLVVAISFLFPSSRFSMTRKNSGNSRDGRNLTNLSLCELPLDNLSADSRESRTPSLVRFQFFSDGENFVDQMIRGFVLRSFWSTTFILKSLKPVFFKSTEPFRKPASTSLNKSKDVIEAISFFIKVYCFTTCFIFIVLFHRLSFSQNVFWKKCRRYKSSLRCYDIF